MPKSTRQPIRPRGQLDLSSVGGGGGSIGVPAATRINARAPLGIAPDTGRFSSSGFAQLSGLYKEYAARADRAQAIAESEARADAREAKAEAKIAAREREAGIKAKTAAMDSLFGSAAGIRIQSEIEMKSRTGEMSFGDANSYIMERFGQESPAYIKAAHPYLARSLAAAQANTAGRTVAETDFAFRAETRQAFHDIHGSYNPDDPEGYGQARRAIYEGRESLGISGEEINRLEMNSLSSTVRRLGTSDPARAQALIDLAYRLRPDGTPSLAASLPTGYDDLNTLQDELDTAILNESVNESKQAREALNESARDNYSEALIALSRLEKPEEVEAWDKEYIGNMDDKELKQRYGDHRASLISALEGMRRGHRTEGSQAALVEHSNAIQRGEADWDAIKGDQRLTPIQQGQLYAEMKTVTQQAALGYIPDYQLANMLLSDLESKWGESIYQTSWNGSRTHEPGKPPEVTAEGHYYQNELLKRLRKLDPKLDVVESNMQKREITQDVLHDVLSGKIRWADSKGSLDAPVPDLKISEKAKAVERLTDREIKVLGRTFTQDGAPGIRDGFGLDYFTLDPDDQRRILGEVQRQKAELEALQQQTLTHAVMEPWASALEQQYQRADEAARLAAEEAERVVRDTPTAGPQWLLQQDEEEAGGPVDLDSPKPAKPEEKPEAEPPGLVGQFFGNLGSVYGQPTIITH